MIDFNCKCFYCERPFNVAPYGLNRPLIETRDHIIPTSLEGGHNAENIVPACTICNGLKGNLLLADFVSMIETHISKKIESPALPFTRLYLILKNANILIANDSKNPNPKYPPIISKKRVKKSFYYDAHLSVNSNTSRSKFFEEAHRQEAIRELLAEPENNFHYL